MEFITCDTSFPPTVVQAAEILVELSQNDHLAHLQSRSALQPPHHSGEAKYSLEDAANKQVEAADMCAEAASLLRGAANQYTS